MFGNNYRRIARRTVIMFLALLIVALGVVGPASVPVPVVQAEGSNLITNGGFETDSNGDGVPDGWTNATTATLSMVDKYNTGSYDYHLFQIGNRAVKVEDDQTGGGGGCIEPSGQYVSVTANISYEVRFIGRNGGDTESAAANQTFYFRVGDDRWEDDVVSATLIDAPNWEYHSFRFKGPANGRAYLQWYTSSDQDGKHFYLDEVVLVEQAQEVTNPSFESNTSGWDSYSATLTRESGGANGTAYALKVQNSTSQNLGGTATSNLGVTIGNYYTLDCFVKKGNTNVRVGMSTGAMGPFYHDILDKTFSSTSWTRIRYNFRATSQYLYVHFYATDTGTDKYFYVDEVYVYESHDEIQAALNQRADAIYSFVESLETSDGGNTYYDVEAFLRRWNSASGDSAKDSASRAVAALSNVYARKWMYTGYPTTYNDDLMDALKALGGLYDRRPSGDNYPQGGTAKWREGIWAEFWVTDRNAEHSLAVAQARSSGVGNHQVRDADLGDCH